MTREEMMTRAQYFVDCKYVARADERQKAMGLAYVEAERQDLAREIVNFAMSCIPAPAQGVGNPDELWAAIRQRDANINAFFAALKAEEDGLRDVEGLRMGDVAMAFQRLRQNLRTPTSLPSTQSGDGE